MKPNRCNYLLGRLLGLFLIPSLTVNLHAAGVWDGGDTSANWSAPLNWDNDAVPVTPLALSFGGVVRLANTNDLTEFTAGGITFSAGAGAFVLSGNSITLDTADLVNNSTSVQTISAPVVLGSARAVNAATGDLVLAGPVTGAFAMTKTGVNKLTLSGGGGTSQLSVPAGAVELSTNGWTQGGTITGLGLTIGIAAATNGSLLISSGTHTVGGDGFGSAVRIGAAGGTGSLQITGGALKVGTAGALDASMNLAGHNSAGGGNGTLSISGNGILEVGRRILFAANIATTNVGTINLSGNGTLNMVRTGSNGEGDLGMIRFGNGTGTINFDGGTYIATGLHTSGATNISTVHFNGTELRANASGGSFGNGGTANLRVDAGGLIFNSNGFDSTIGSPLGNSLTTTGTLTKNGAGVLTLSAVNPFTGPTVVNAGTLALTSAASLASSSSITLAGPATLSLGGAGAKTINSLTVGAGATILGLVGVPMTGTSTTVTNTLAFNGGVTTLGIGALFVQPTPGAVFDLLQAGSITGTATLNLNFGGASRVTGTAAIVGNKVQVTVTSPSAALIWNNSTTDGLWNLNSSANFANVSANDVFKQYDSVTFSDAPASGAKTVTLGTDILIPGALTVNNSDGDYTLTGGTIDGPAALTKSGTSTLTINGTHGFTGGVTVNGGTFISATSRSLGSINNNVVVNNPGSTIRFNNHDSFGQASTVPTSTVTANNGAIITNGNSYTTFGRLNLNSSSLIANGGASAAYQAFKLAGEVKVTGTSAIGVTATPGNAFAQVHLGGNIEDAQTPFNIIGPEDALTVSAIIRNAVTGTGGTAIKTGLIKNGAGTMLFTNNNIYTGVTTIDGGTLVVGDGATSGSLGTGAVVNNATLVFNRSDELIIAEAISGTGTFRQAGAGTTILAGTNTYTGNTEVVTGTLKINTAMLEDGADVAVTSGGVLHLNFAGADAVDGLYIDGVPQVTGTWGGVGSGADHITARITGTGVLDVQTLDPYDAWAIDKGLTGASIGKALDPDDDGMSNLGEYALDDTPMSGNASGKIVTKVADLNGQKILTLTLPVRVDTEFKTGVDQVDALISIRKDGLTYRIEGSDSLGNFNLFISELDSMDSTAVRTGMNLPSPTEGWTYRTFRTPGTVSTAAKQFIRAKVTDAP